MLDPLNDDGLSSFQNGEQNGVVLSYCLPKYRSYACILLIIFQFPQKLQDLLKGFFNKDPKKRLGHKGVEEIKAHPWF